METLDTPAPLGIPALVEVYTVALNAHPACDYNGNGECLVTYPCAGNSILGLEQTFNTDHLCVGVLEPRTGKRKVSPSGYHPHWLSHSLAVSLANSLSSYRRQSNQQCVPDECTLSPLTCPPPSMRAC